MSADLQWLLIRKFNSFMVKGLPEGPIMSREQVGGIITHVKSWGSLGKLTWELIFGSFSGKLVERSLSQVLWSR